jgi:hypothetical protein
MSPHQHRGLEDDRGFANGREEPVESDEDRAIERNERFKTSNWCEEMSSLSRVQATKEIQPMAAGEPEGQLRTAAKRAGTAKSRSVSHYKPQWAIAFVATVLMFPAHAASPPAASLDAQVMGPYGNAIRNLKRPDTGTGCCDESDCRPVEYHIVTTQNETYYEVFIRRYTEDGSGWPAGPDKWVRVPNAVIIPPDQRKGIPVPIACWAHWNSVNNGLLCFTPGDGS